MPRTATESVLALRWLNSLLAPELAPGHSLAGLLGGFHTIPPVGVLSPYGVVRGFTAAEDLTGLDNAVLIWSPQLIQVNVYDRKQNSYSRLEPLAAAIYTLLNAQNGVLANGVVYGCMRIRTYADVTVVDDVQERAINQQFQVQAQASDV